MSTTTPLRKTTTPASSTPAGGLRKPVGPSTPGRGPSPTKSAASSQVSGGVTRSPSTRAGAGSTRPARPAAARRPGSVAGASGQSLDQLKDEDTKAENSALIEGLRESVRNAENMSEDYQNKLLQAQQKVDELLQEHAKMEERFQESLEKNEQLETDKRESTKKLHESDAIYESEKVAMLKDREESAVREEELRTTVKLLKDKLVGRDKSGDDHDGSRTGRPPTREELQPESPSFAPSSALRKPSSPQRSDSKSTSRLVMQKDQLIESLRLELAEVQVKLLEAENQGGGRMAELEKTLLETRMTNARLMEDNESYQLLLGEKTMNGEMGKSDMLQNHHVPDMTGLGSLAEELETAENNDEKVQQLTARVKTLEDEKKALTLYVEKMLVKIMNHADQQSMLDADQVPPKPPPKEMQASEGQSQGAAILGNISGGISRSLSVFGKRQRPVSQITVSSTTTEESQGRTRPSSQIIAPTAQTSRSPPAASLTPHNDPLKAPSIPLGRSSSVQVRSRGHRRTQSSQSAISPGLAETGLGGLTGPPPMQRQISGSRSPAGEHGSGPNTPRNSFFAPSASARTASTANTTPATGSIAEEAPALPSSASYKVSSSGASFASHENGEAGASPPRNGAGQTNYTGAVMTQNKLRPLRLVQQGKEEKEAEEAARKKANRASWMGWFNRGGENGPPSAGLPPLAGGRTISGNMTPTEEVRKENIEPGQA